MTTLEAIQLRVAGTAGGPFYYIRNLFHDLSFFSQLNRQHRYAHQACGNA